MTTAGIVITGAIVASWTAASSHPATEAQRSAQLREPKSTQPSIPIAAEKATVAPAPAEAALAPLVSAPTVASVAPVVPTKRTLLPVRARPATSAGIRTSADVATFPTSPAASPDPGVRDLYDRRH
jgi:hypothetical protein